MKKEKREKSDGWERTFLFSLFLLFLSSPFLGPQRRIGPRTQLCLEYSAWNSCRVSIYHGPAEVGLPDESQRSYDGRHGIGLPLRRTEPVLPPDPPAG